MRELPLPSMWTDSQTLLVVFFARSLRYWMCGSPRGTAASCFQQTFQVTRARTRCQDQVILAPRKGYWHHSQCCTTYQCRNLQHYTPPYAAHSPAVNIHIYSTYALLEVAKEIHLHKTLKNRRPKAAIKQESPNTTTGPYPAGWTRLILL